MRKVVALAFVTLDGFTTGPGGETDWQLRAFNEEMGEFVFQEYAAADILLLGRRTYEQFADYWQQQPAADPEALRMNSVSKIVFSNTLTTAAWKNTTLVSNNIPLVISQLKQQPGKDLLIVGSIGLIQSFTNMKLIDEFRLLIYPVMLGTGRRLFANLSELQQFTFIRSRIFSNGVLLGVYKPAPQWKCSFM
ncbi:dihydrofolate reductase family protein [Chitinophaga sp. Cy-1792]|uniref:dihydrofolate reductase family protein n=1 Tax=Chitinophaga sp. Cy-1792 TaxID=2608339 RepID=UPI00142329F8|nr:dihydrofolate reductase family protein [Chitinophaga sp. Cy-1792]NIG54161.1 dihydrofolate reductase family protein [Chitinophaga sp. Cy-1792]